MPVSGECCHVCESESVELAVAAVGDAEGGEEAAGVVGVVVVGEGEVVLAHGGGARLARPAGLI